MGLISAALGAAGGVMADQWKDYFYCESLPVDILVVKGQNANPGVRRTRGAPTISSRTVPSWPWPTASA